MLSDRQMYTIDEIEQSIPHFPKKTLRYAIRRLLEYNLVKSVSNLEDMRTVYYRVSSDSEINNSLQSLEPNIATKIQSAFRFMGDSGQLA